MFQDRHEAGILLAGALARWRSAQTIVLALPRGGVEVADPVAEALDAPLDVICVRKLGTPGHEELGIGAVAEGGFLYVDRDLAAALGVAEYELDELVTAKRREVAARARLFRRGRAPLDVEGRTAIVVDDGIATGGTMIAALLALRARAPGRVILAVPVAPPSTIERLRAYADEVVALRMPEDFTSVGTWYEDFTQVADERVVELLARRRPPEPRRLP